MHKKIVSILVVVLLAGFGIMGFIQEKKDFSEVERRYLADSPVLSVDTILDGSFVDNAFKYLDDHTYMRNDMLKLNAIYNSIVLKSENNGVYFGKDSYLIGKYDAIDKIETITDSIYNFASNNTDVQTAVILVPSSLVVNENKLPMAVSPQRQLEDMHKIYNELDCCETINVKDILVSENQNRNVFYKTDSHLTSYGSYAVYKQYCIESGLRYHSINEFAISEVVDDFKGDLYYKAGNYLLKGEVIEKIELKGINYEVLYGKSTSNSVYDDRKLDGSDKYAYFLSGNRPITKINNMDKRNGENLLVIKDSIGNSIIPYLIDHYKSITVIDPRYYTDSISEYINNNQIARVLFIYSMSTIGSDLGIRSIE